MIFPSGLSEYRSITEVEECDRGWTAEALALDGLYDLARHLTRNGREAERLIATSLRAFAPHTLESLESMHVLRSRLVRNYLQHERSLAGRLAVLASAVQVRSKGSQVAASRLEAGLDRLSPEERVCLILRERLGVSVAEIARITGFRRERVSIALYKARERLRKSLPEEGDSWEQ